MFKRSEKGREPTEGSNDASNGCSSKHGFRIKHYEGDRKANTEVRVDQIHLKFEMLVINLANQRRKGGSHRDGDGHKDHGNNRGKERGIQKGQDAAAAPDHELAEQIDDYQLENAEDASEKGRQPALEK